MLRFHCYGTIALWLRSRLVLSYWPINQQFAFAIMPVCSYNGLAVTGNLLVAHNTNRSTDQGFNALLHQVLKLLLAIIITQTLQKWAYTQYMDNCQQLKKNYEETLAHISSSELASKL